MNSNFDAHNCSGQKAARDMDSLQRDRFELISAYIDGEVTAAERYQVQDWLANDANSQRLYARLMKLRQGLHQLPVPATQVTTQETANQVFTRIDRRRIRNTMVWGGAAIAAMFVSAFSGILPGSQFMPRLAQTPVTEKAAEPLMIAVNRPVIQIPKAKSASPENFIDSAIFNR
ncbi:anti-sigma factor family protein [Coleofasciculus sp.]|uniref:anti-sigma factor family protein n=2 Tax=Coleofasciculus sp. TaxID=3100458 RepID=UPI003A377F8B